MSLRPFAIGQTRAMFATACYSTVNAQVLAVTMLAMPWSERLSILRLDCVCQATMKVSHVNWCPLRLLAPHRSQHVWSSASTKCPGKSKNFLAKSEGFANKLQNHDELHWLYALQRVEFTRCQLLGWSAAIKYSKVSKKFKASLCALPCFCNCLQLWVLAYFAYLLLCDRPLSMTLLAWGTVNTVVPTGCAKQWSIGATGIRGQIDLKEMLTGKEKELGW